MDKMSIRIFMIAALGMAVFLSAPASASLTGLQFGFPVIVQSGQSISFSSDLFSSTDLESINIDFPMFDGMMSSSGISTGGLTHGSMPMSSMVSGMGSLFDLSMFKLY